MFKSFENILNKICEKYFSPVDSGNGTHESDSGDGSSCGDKDFVMDESSVEDSDSKEEEREKKKNVKTGKNSGKKLKMWQITTPFKDDPIKEAKRQRAIQARKNRERSNLNKQSLQEKYDNLQKKYEKMVQEKTESC